MVPRGNRKETTPLRVERRRQILLKPDCRQLKEYGVCLQQQCQGRRPSQKVGKAKEDAPGPSGWGREAQER